jgi:hypothetical protein
MQEVTAPHLHLTRLNLLQIGVTASSIIHAVALTEQMLVIMPMRPGTSGRTVAFYGSRSRTAENPPSKNALANDIAGAIPFR